MTTGSEHSNVARKGATEYGPKGGSKEIEDFIYLISHDVRSSVRALIELPQWIVEDLEGQGVKIEGPVATSIEMLNRHTGRLDRMLVDLLTFFRIGRMQEVRRIDLDSAIDTVLEAMEVPHGFQVVRNLECDSFMMGERDVLTLLSALIQNAIKHHDRTSGKIILMSEKQGNDVLLCVSDDGPGITEEFTEKVFGAMTTLRPRDEVEGSGMGLAQVRKIAQHYGGDATATASSYGRGTQIRVRFSAG
ncbi:MAG: GHKL domain-containing protein [Sulfitobacter sp.]|nr:GHKL domain-containing protein [Sulfitobacter sp.]